MNFYEFGKANGPIVILIHGVFQPYQTLIPIAEHFMKEYTVIIPALNGHTSNKKSSFVSVEKEAEEIETYILEKHSKNIKAVFGFSMGGVVAFTLLKNKILNIENLILDGAPLLPSGKLITSVMTSNYLKIAKKSKSRDKKTLKNFSANFLPEKFLQNYLDFIDYTTDESIRNILISINENRLCQKTSLGNTKLLYLHGTKSNEYISKKCGKAISKLYPEATVVCFKGDGHCQCAIYEPEDWVEIALDFIENR